MIDHHDPDSVRQLETAQLVEGTAQIRQAKVVAKGTGVSLFGAVSLRGLNYLLSIVVARLLGASLFGLFSLGLSLVTVAQSVALLGLDIGGARYTARYRTQNDPTGQRQMTRWLVLLVLTWGTVLALALYFMVGPVAARSDQDIILATQILRWFAPAVPLAALLVLLTALLDGQRRIGVGVMTRDVLRPAMTLLLAILVLWTGRNLLSVVQAYVLSLLLAVLVTGVFIYRYSPSKSAAPNRASGFSLREVLAFSLPVFPAKLLKQVGNFLEIFLLGMLATTTDVGVFSAAARSATLVAFGLQAIMRIYMTLAAELYTKSDFNQLESLQHLATRWATLLSAPALLTVLLLGRQIMALFGEAFVPYASVLVILALGQTINAITGPIAGTLMMAGYSRLILLNNVLALSLNIVVDWILIIRFGVIGAAVGSAAVLVLVNLVAVVEVQHLLGIRSFGRDLLSPALASLITLILVWLILGRLGSLPTLAYLVSGLVLIAIVFTLAYWVFAPDEDKRMVALARSRLRNVRLSAG